MALEGGAVLGLMLLGDAVIYATSPQDLIWYLTLSFDRLLYQIWPSLVFLIFLAVRIPFKLTSSR